MEEEILDSTAEKTAGYVPRPRWQIWLARIALAAFIIMLILYYAHYFRG